METLLAILGTILTVFGLFGLFAAASPSIVGLHLLLGLGPARVRGRAQRRAAHGAGRLLDRARRRERAACRPPSCSRSAACSPGSRCATPCTGTGPRRRRTRSRRARSDVLKAIPEDGLVEVYAFYTRGARAARQAGARQVRVREPAREGALLRSERAARSGAQVRDLEQGGRGRGLRRPVRDRQGDGEGGGRERAVAHARHTPGGVDQEEDLLPEGPRRGRPERREGSGRVGRARRARGRERHASRSSCSRTRPRCPPTPTR